VMPGAGMLVLQAVLLPTVTTSFTAWFSECSGAGLSSQAKLLVDCRQKATKQV